MSFTTIAISQCRIFYSLSSALVTISICHSTIMSFDHKYIHPISHTCYFHWYIRRFVLRFYCFSFFSSLFCWCVPFFPLMCAFNWLSVSSSLFLCGQRQALKQMFVCEIKCKTVERLQFNLLFSFPHTFHSTDSLPLRPNKDLMRCVFNQTCIDVECTIDSWRYGKRQLFVIVHSCYHP